MSKTLATQKVAAVLVGFAAVIVVSFAFATTVKAVTVAELQAQIAALTAQLATMGGSTTSSTAGSGFTFTRTLSLGMSNADVKQLQIVLNSSADTQVSATGIGSAGNESSYFGAKTKAAVIKFQEKYMAEILTPVGLSKGTGTVGASTRAQLNKMTAGTTGTTGTTGGTTGTTGTTAGSLSVALAPVQPSGTIISGAAAAKLADITFVGSGAVKTLKLARTGISTDSVINNIYLYDGNVRVSDAASINNGVITFNASNGLFTVNGSRTISVRADIAASDSTTSYAGNTLGVSVTSITPVGGSDTAVTGVVGPQLAVTTISNAATIGVTTAPTPTAQSINAGTTGYAVWSDTFNVGTRAVNLKSITFKYTGSASTDALANVKLFIDGVDSAATPVWSSGSGTNRVGFDFGATPKSLTTGSHTIELRADIVGGSYRDFTVSIENAGDFVAEDSQVAGYNVAPTYNSSTFANVSAGKITVNAGSLTATLDPAFGSVTKVVGGASNVAFASYKLQAYGEDVKVESVNITPAFGTTPTQGANGLRNLTLYVNGGAVGSSYSTWTTGVHQFTLGSSLIIPAGTSVILTVKADMMTSTSTNYTSGTLSATMSIPANGYKGMTSSTYNSSATSNLSSSPVTISTSNVSFGVTSGFTAKTVAPNQSAVKIGSYTLQTGSAEGITVTNIAVALHSSASEALTNFSNLTVSDAANPVGQPTASNNFSVNYDVPASGSKTIDVYADASTASISASTTVTVSYRGKTSGVSNTTSATLAPDIAFSAGTLNNVALNSSALPAQYVVGGMTNFVAGPFTATTTGSDITIKRIKFYSTSTNALAGVTVTDSAGAHTKSFVSSYADVDGLNINVPVGSTGANIPVSFNFAAVNSQTSNANQYVGAQVTEIEYSSGITTTVITSATEGTISTTTTHFYKLVGTKPTLTVTNTSNSGLTTGLQKLGEFTIAADAAGAVRVNAVPLTFATSSTATVSAVEIRDGGSNAISGSSCTVNASYLCTLTGYDIPAGTSKTFSIYGSVAGSLGTGGTSYVTTGLGSAANFSWYDLQGVGTGTALNGSLIYNYPTNTYSTHN
jgi:hypothetical protein